MNFKLTMTTSVNNISYFRESFHEQMMDVLSGINERQTRFNNLFPTEHTRKFVFYIKLNYSYKHAISKLK